jgi:hypothetical protein
MGLKAKIVSGTSVPKFEKELQATLDTMDRGSIQYRFDNGRHVALVISETPPEEKE